MNKILITGSTGFIGSNLVSHLAKQEIDRIYALHRSKPATSGSKFVEYIQHDLLEKLSSDKLPQELDCIVHLAAVMDKTIDNFQMFQINTFGTLALLEYSRNVGVKKFIFASTGGVYGYSKEILSEECQVNPIGFYALSKYQAEILVKYYSQYFQTVVLRFFFPYGPGQAKGIIPTIFKRIKNNQPVILNNGGNPHINPIHISDVVKLISNAITLESESTIVNICGDEVISIRDLAELISKYLAIDPIYENKTEPTISNLVGDTSRMKAIFKYTCRVPIEKGIEEFVSYESPPQVRKNHF